jgi:hypothetical protein
MHRFLPALLTAVILLFSASVRGAEPPARDESAEDEELLKAAGVAVTGPGLLEFFRQRTLTAADQERIKAQIRQLGDKSFRAREQAATALAARGSSALPALRHALDDGDPEVRRRVKQCIDVIERGPGSTLPLAALHLVRDRKPDGAPGVLLGYLPFADDEAVDEELLTILLVLGLRDGKADPALVDALSAPLPARRAAAALVLGRSGTPEQRAVVRRLFTDGDPKVRLRAAQGLIAGQDKSAVPVLVSLLSDSPLDLAVQAEDLLGRLAGDKAPPVALGEEAATRRACRTAWEVWWKSNGATINLARAEVDAPLFNPALRARTATQQFMDALGKGDTATLRRVTEVPFTIATFKVFAKRDELDPFLKEITEHVQRQKLKLTLGKLVSLEEYMKTTPGERDFLGKLPKAEVRVLYAVIVADGRPEDVAFFLRLGGGRARIIGLGNGKPPGGAVR